MASQTFALWIRRGATNLLRQVEALRAEDDYIFRSLFLGEVWSVVWLGGIPQMSTATRECGADQLFPPQSVHCNFTPPQPDLIIYQKLHLP